MVALPLPGGDAVEDLPLALGELGERRAVEPAPVAKWAITRAAISGPKIASPAAAARIARTISSCSAPLSR